MIIRGRSLGPRRLIGKVAGEGDSVMMTQPNQFTLIQSLFIIIPELNPIQIRKNTNLFSELETTSILGL